MPEHEDEMEWVFRNAYGVLMERRPAAPTFEEIKTLVTEPIRGDHVEPDEQPLGRPTTDVAWEDVEISPSEEHNRWSSVALAVAAAILIVVGVVVVAERDRDDVVTQPASVPADDVVTQPASVPADDSVVTSNVDNPSSTIEPSGTLEDRAVFPGAQLSSVTAGGPGLVAVGSTESGAVVWTSVDGITWSRVPHDEEVFGDVAWISGVTVGGPGLIAVGSTGSAAVVWTSVDGITWSRVPHDEEVFGRGSMSGVVAGGPGIVAVGSVNSGDDPDPRTGADAAVWTSIDGITWSRVPHDDAIFGGADNQEMLDVTVGGPGLVAVGREGQNVWDYALWQVAAVWTSVDGIAWSRVPHDDAAFGNEDDRSEEWVGQAMLGVTAGGPGLVAVGGETLGPEPFVSAVWTSVDGITWSRVEHDPKVFARGMFWPMLDVTAAGPGLVAVGDGVWTSVDGRTWSLSSEIEATIWSVTVGGPGLVAVGETAPGNGAVWTSTDGTSWVRRS
ncbi:MAG: hypothetical protein ACR2N2_03815 [Acidimicrobiia bacterium]